MSGLEEEQARLRRSYPDVWGDSDGKEIVETNFECPCRMCFDRKRLVFPKESKNGEYYEEHIHVTCGRGPCPHPDLTGPPNVPAVA